MQNSEFASSILPSLAGKIRSVASFQRALFPRVSARLSRVLAFSLALAAWSASSAELPSLKLAMARHEAGSKPFFSPASPLMTIARADDDSATIESRLTDALRPLSLAISPARVSYLEKTVTARTRLAWFSVNSPESTAPKRHRQVLLGYGAVYYDSYYDKLLPMFERKGTRVEEPGCGYVKISFNF